MKPMTFEEGHRRLLQSLKAKFERLLEIHQDKGVLNEGNKEYVEAL